MSEALYNTEILRLAADIPHLGGLAGAQARARRVSPICGSRVDVGLSLDAQGRVARFGQEVRACALGQASAAILGAGVIGRTPAELAQARDELAAFLSQADAPPPRLFPRAAVFAPARAHRARHASIRLAFEAAAQAAAEAAARAGDGQAAEAGARAPNGQAAAATVALPGAEAVARPPAGAILAAPGAAAARAAPGAEARARQPARAGAP